MGLIVNRTELKRWSMYVGFILIVMTMQEYLLTRLKIAGVHPMLGGVLTACIAMYEGGLRGGAFGLFVGIVQDALLIGPEGYYSLVYMGSGLAAGFICDYMFRRNFLTACLWSLAVTALTTLLYFTIFFLLIGRAGISELWRTAVPEIIYSVILLPIIYFPVRYISQIGIEQ